MDVRYDQAWKEVSEKADAIVAQLVELSERVDELRKDKVLEGELMYSTEEVHEELEEYCHNLTLLEEGLSESISWIGGNLAIARGEDY